MINFRYHIVSLVAVFLALAVGVVVGTTALNGPITDGLRKQVDSLGQQRATLTDQVNQLKAQTAGSNAFAQRYGPQIIKGQLSGKQVLIMGMPGAAPSVKDAVAQDIGAAGGTVSGRIQMAADYFNPARAADIRSLVTNGTQPTGLTLPGTDDAGQLGGALLSYVLTGKGNATDITRTLAAFSTLQMLSVEGGGTVQPANMVVVVSAGAPTDPTVGRNQFTLISKLQNASATVVVAGDSTANTGSGLIRLVRADPTANNAISTVDNADTALGQLAAVLALRAPTPGAYGTGKGATAPFPTPVG